MLKEHERREYLKSLDQEKREKEEKRMQELKEKHRQHPKVNAPVGDWYIRVRFYQKPLEMTQVFSLFLKNIFPTQGSVDQLREVWEETDGLDPQEFNPKTFFKLHGGWQQLALSHSLFFMLMGYVFLKTKKEGFSFILCFI